MLEIGGTAAVKSVEVVMAPLLLRSPSGRPVGWRSSPSLVPKYRPRVKCVGWRDQAQEHDGSFPLPRTRSPMTLVLGDTALAHSHQRFIQRGVQSSCNSGGRRRAAATHRPQRCDHVVVGRRIRFFGGRGGSCQFSDLLRADDVNRSRLPP